MHNREECSDTHLFDEVEHGPWNVSVRNSASDVPQRPVAIGLAQQLHTDRLSGGEGESRAETSGTQWEGEAYPILRQVHV